MYGYSVGMMGDPFGMWGTFGFLTWLALITFLVLGIIFFWQEINKPKGKR